MANIQIKNETFNYLPNNLTNTTYILFFGVNISFCLMLKLRKFILDLKYNREESAL